MNLPESFVNEGRELARDLLIFDVPIATLSHDELLAAAAHGWDSYRRSIDESLRSLKFMGDVLRMNREEA